MKLSDSRIGIALGAGAARGWAHIGVLRALEEADIHPHVVCGTSIGALVGAAYADDRLEELEKWVTTLTWKKVIGFFDIGFAGGLLKGGRVTSFVRQHFADKDISVLTRPFGTVATDLQSGRELWLRAGPITEAVRASIAMPGLFPPWPHEGRLLVDGALVNPVPVSLCRALGADFVIAVDLSSSLVGPAVANVTAEKEAAYTPGMAEIVMASLNIMSTRITRSRLAGEPADVVIMPRLGQFGLLDYHHSVQAISEGRDATAILTPQIHRLLNYERKNP
ncbi:MAG TPA: patatin-like phospholipase family protein [Burkholderiales bacterium]|nr:patatin-like phospholipase family protein [Burkholderiales bacterium]